MNNQVRANLVNKLPLNLKNRIRSIYKNKFNKEINSKLDDNTFWSRVVNDSRFKHVLEQCELNISNEVRINT